MLPLGWFLLRLFPGIGWGIGGSQLVNAVVGTSIGAFVGAWVALRLQVRRDSRRRQDSRLAAGKRAQFVLMDQQTFLMNMIEQVLRPHVDDPERWHTVPRFIHEQQELPLDVPSLMFLLDTDDPNLLQSLLLGERDYFTALQELRERNEVHFEFVRKRAALQADGVELRTEPDYADYMGADFVLMLKSLTDLLYDKVKEAANSNELNFKWLTSCLKANFADRVDQVDRHRLPERVYDDSGRVQLPDANFPAADENVSGPA